ncbi:MAG TPA: class I SAM-dependent methyltransferase [Pseudonocardiaceae bacterium]
MTGTDRRVDVVPSPNIWHWPAVYEVENRAQDAGGAIWRLLRERCDWAGRDVVDVGCGDGFHLPVFAATARSVIGVEPHPPLVRRAARRVAAMSHVRVVTGGAERLPLPSDSADVVHARTAYFFGRGAEPGLAEADRVLRPGGALAIVDLDVTWPPYGDWMLADLPDYDAADVWHFFAEQGFDSRRVHTVWRFADRADLAEVLRIEFSVGVAERALAATPGLTVPVGYRVHVRRKPTGLVLPD